MPKSITARFGSRVVTVQEALEIRGTEKRTKSQAEFFCEECDKPVRPHKAGGDFAEHFEHLAHNPQCSRSHEKKA
jgi:competence CoiA-like predicted nuclease